MKKIVVEFQRSFATDSVGLYIMRYEIGGGESLEFAEPLDIKWNSRPAHEVNPSPSLILGRPDMGFDIENTIKSIRMVAGEHAMKALHPQTETINAMEKHLADLRHVANTLLEKKREEPDAQERSS